MSIAARNAILAGGGSTGEYWGLYFEAAAANVVVNMSKSGSPPSVTMEYSTDGKTWTTFDPNGTTPVTLAAVGDRVYFRAGQGGNTAFASSTSNYWNFTLSGSAGAHGNIMSLVDGGNPNNVTIPAAWCFAMLFRGCNNLTTPPELPATTLTSDCYHGLFWECRNLESAPALPAKTMKSGCYDTMFYYCSKVRSINIQATTLASTCFSWMAYSSGVNDVTVAFTSWYGVNATNAWLGYPSSTGTFTCPSALGTNDSIQRGLNYCPTGWTVINNNWQMMIQAEAAGVVIGLASVGTPSAVSLEASTDLSTWTAFNSSITLANIGDVVYFRAGQGGNTRLASSANDYHHFTLSGAASAHGNVMSLLDGSNPTNVTITGTYAFAGLFKGCANLTSAPNLPATTLTAYCYSEMFSGCSALATPPTLPASTMQQGCYMRMFYGCSALTSIAGLESLALVQDCCTEMYKGCTSITSAAVGAAEITTNGYAGLFDGCSSLSAISCGWDTWGSSASYLADWVKGVAASGTFTCSAFLGTSATIERGDNRCPTGWTVANPSEYWGLNFEAEAAGVVVGMAKSGSPSDVTLQYSRNNIVWSTFTPGTTTVTLASIGDKVYFRAGSGGNYAFGSSFNDHYYFTLSGSAGAHGNIMSLLDGTSQSLNTLGNYAFNGLFSNCANLTTAPTLPATSLGYCCYRRLFYGCTSLTTAPTLPATTISYCDFCYADMFQGCTLLTTAPALPATSLSDYCYANMFNGCTSLTTAPALSATTLASYCYYQMFQGCTSLTTAPALPAMTMADSCYRQMFNGCTSLTAAPALPATSLSSNCYADMFAGCASLTTAPALPAMTMAESCYLSMFRESGLTAAPDLPATTLATDCYRQMFYQSGNMTTAPAILPATTLASRCYYEMFASTKITSAPKLPATTLVDSCYALMFWQCRHLTSIEVGFTAWNPASATNIWCYAVPSSGTFTCPAALGDDSTITRGASNCPTGWTVVNT